jgi:hypothetical protein
MTESHTTTTAHNNEFSGNASEMNDLELCIEQQSLLHSHDGDEQYEDIGMDMLGDTSKDKPAKMLSSYRGRRRLAVVAAVAVAVTLAVVAVWTEGTFYNN